MKAIVQALGSQNFADINPARTDPGGDWPTLAADRPAQAGAFAGRHRRGASELLLLFSDHYGTPDQCGSDACSLAHPPVSRAVHHCLAGGWRAPCKICYAPLQGPLMAVSVEEIVSARHIRQHGERIRKLLNHEARQARAALPEQQRIPVIPRRVRRHYRAALVEIFARRFSDGGRRREIDDCFRALF